MEMKDFNRRRKCTVDKFNNTPPFNVKQFVDDGAHVKISINPSQNYGSYELESKNSLTPTMKLAQIKSMCCNTLKRSSWDKITDKYSIKEKRNSDIAFVNPKIDRSNKNDYNVSVKNKPEDDIVRNTKLNHKLMEKLLTPIPKKCSKSKSAPKIRCDYDKIFNMRYIRSDTHTNTGHMEKYGDRNQKNQKFSENTMQFNNTQFNKNSCGDSNEDYAENMKISNEIIVISTNTFTGDQVIRNLEHLQKVCTVNPIDESVVLDEQIYNIDFEGNSDESIRKALFKEKLNRILARKLYQIKYRERIIKELDITANFCQNNVKMPSHHNDTFSKDSNKDVKFSGQNIKMNQNCKFEKYMKLAKDVGDTKFINNETFNEKNMMDHEIVKNTLKSFHFDEHFPDLKNKDLICANQQQSSDMEDQLEYYQDDHEENITDYEPYIGNFTQNRKQQQFDNQNNYQMYQHYNEETPDQYLESEEDTTTTTTIDRSEDSYNNEYCRPHNSYGHYHDCPNTRSADYQQQGSSQNAIMNKANRSEINIPKNFVRQQVEIYNSQVQFPKINNKHHQMQMLKNRRNMPMINKEGCKSTVENIRHHCCRNHNIINSMGTNIEEYKHDKMDSEGDGDTWNDGSDSTPRVSFPKETRNAVAMMMNRCNHVHHHCPENPAFEQNNQHYSEREPKVIPHLPGKLKIGSMPCPKNLLCEKGVHDGSCNIKTKKCWPGVATRISQNHNNKSFT